MTHIVNQLEDSACWSEINPNKCPCRGKGWIISDYDTVHKCNQHAKNAPTPHDYEDEYYSQRPYDWNSHTEENYKEAYQIFLANTKMKENDFRNACIEKNDGIIPATLSQWVDCAEQVYLEYEYETSEEFAKTRGYSCALEMRLAEEVEEEKRLIQYQAYFRDDIYH